ncbi:MAG: rod shape-determining protein MreC [Calditrichaeota bacterium]|nr:rod shape-determining protein MreC [Calditrichota bacterium]MCB9391625.1 rod shape-determining protein MreC [Calditrichota bacterium]
MPAHNRKVSGNIEWTVYLLCMAVSLVLLLTSPKPGVRELKDSTSEIIGVAATPLQFVRKIFNIWLDHDLLRKHAQNLSTENSELRDALIENQRLRGMLNMQERLPFQTVPASVISAVGPALGGQYRISTGALAGVTINSAVITPLGLVGKVIETTDHTSLVQTLVGNSYGVAVMLERTRMRGILRWTGIDRWTLSGLPTGVDVKPGDLVITAGTGAVFPKGLRVGVVTDESSVISTYGESWIVQPFVEFRSVEDVFVIISTGWLEPNAGANDPQIEPNP